MKTLVLNSVLGNAPDSLPAAVKIRIVREDEAGGRGRRSARRGLSRFLARLERLDLREQVARLLEAGGGLLRLIGTALASDEPGAGEDQAKTCNQGIREAHCGSLSARVQPRVSVADRRRFFNRNPAWAAPPVTG
jgi:hypothetical protein